MRKIIAECLCPSIECPHHGARRAEVERMGEQLSHARGWMDLRDGELVSANSQRDALQRQVDAVRAAIDKGDQHGWSWPFTVKQVRAALSGGDTPAAPDSGDALEIENAITNLMRALDVLRAEVAPLTAQVADLRAENERLRAVVDEARRLCDAFVQGAGPNAVLAEIVADLRAALSGGDTPEPPSEVFLAYDGSWLWGVYASREAAQAALDERMHAGRRDVQVTDDWQNLNVPEARPCWWRYFTSDGSGEAHAQRIDLVEVRPASPDPEKGQSS